MTVFFRNDADRRCSKLGPLAHRYDINGEPGRRRRARESRPSGARGVRLFQLVTYPPQYLLLETRRSALHLRERIGYPLNILSHSVLAWRKFYFQSAFRYNFK